MNAIIKTLALLALSTLSIGCGEVQKEISQKSAKCRLMIVEDTNPVAGAYFINDCLNDGTPTSVHMFNSESEYETLDAIEKELEKLRPTVVIRPMLDVGIHLYPHPLRDAAREYYSASSN